MTLAQTHRSDSRIAARPLQDAGRPLEPALRSRFEPTFGQDLSQVRVHDDARAHDAARELGALAYATGDHVVFGQGQYRPDTRAGTALIAHELAHTVQQGGVQLKPDGVQLKPDGVQMKPDGVQMKPDGVMATGGDARLEAEANAAAAAALEGRPAPALSRLGAPAILRAVDPPASPAPATPAGHGDVNLPPGMTVEVDDPPGLGNLELSVWLDHFDMPLEKGKGDWVQSTHDALASRGGLAFIPLFDGNRIAAWKEDTRTADYQSTWLSMYGFKAAGDVKKEFETSNRPAVVEARKNSAVAGMVAKFSQSFAAAGCDVDHIVEKQMGGSSIPSNLQLLVSGKNRSAGRQTYTELVKVAESIRALRGANVRKLTIRIRKVVTQPGSEDPSFIVEKLLRDGDLGRKQDVLAGGPAITLDAGGRAETIPAAKKGETEIGSMATRLVPGMKLKVYARRAKNAKDDEVRGDLDNRAMSKSHLSEADKGVTLLASEAEQPPQGVAAPATQAAPASASAAERRSLKIANAHPKIPFYYPYLSPGEVTSLALDAQSRLTGAGVIHPSVKFLGDLKFTFGPDTMTLDQEIDVKAVNGSRVMKPLAPMFRFTSGQLTLDLMAFRPGGRMEFTMGPAGKPIIAGDITAGLEGGAFMARGALRPAGPIPGVKEAEGKVVYDSEKGWSGELAATSSTIAKSTAVDVKFGFRQEGDGVRFYGGGAIASEFHGAQLKLAATWKGGAPSYAASATVAKPLPLVDSVDLKGDYANDLLHLVGKARATWQGQAVDVTVTYTRKDGEDGKFSGAADVNLKTDRLAGKLQASFDEKGGYRAGGALTYRLTKDVAPTLKAEATPRGVKLGGEVKIADIPLTREWPKPGGERRDIIKGLGVKFPAPTPIPGVTVFGEIGGSLGVGYGLGPVALKDVSLDGELWPFDADPKIKASLSGRLVAPAHGELYGTIAAALGVEVGAGLVGGVKGGLKATPSLRVEGEAGMAVKADYDGAGFSFGAKAYARGQMKARVGVDLDATLYALGGALSHTWSYPVGQVEKTLGPELNLNLGEFKYAKNGEITWPSLDQVSLDPKEFDPLALCRELMSESKVETAQ